MPSSRHPRLRCSLVLLLALPLLSVGVVNLSGCKDSAAKHNAPAPFDTYFPIQVGAKSVRMQLALLDGERQQGLMFRPGLGAEDGMLFLERYPKQHSFWMQNVSFPLDIGYFNAEGVLLEVHPMYARDERHVTSHSSDIKFALEMNLGWYAKNNVKAGAKLDLAAVKAAVDQRGMDPERWALK